MHGFRGALWRDGTDRRQSRVVGYFRFMLDNTQQFGMLSGMKNKTKTQIVTIGGEIQKKTWNPTAEEWDYEEIDVRAFERRWMCHPLEAQTFYPETFVVV